MVRKFIKQWLTYIIRENMIVTNLLIKVERCKKAYTIFIS
jgi:hypothetical protein